jgi:hypothetical protein
MCECIIDLSGFRNVTLGEEIFNCHIINKAKDSGCVIKLQKTLTGVMKKVVLRDDSRLFI